MQRFLQTVDDDKLDLEPWVQETEVVRVHNKDDTPCETVSTPMEEVKTRELEVANIQIF